MHIAWFRSLVAAVAWLGCVSAGCTPSPAATLPSPPSSAATASPTVATSAAIPDDAASEPPPLAPVTAKIPTEARTARIVGSLPYDVDMSGMVHLVGATWVLERFAGMNEKQERARFVHVFREGAFHADPKLLQGAPRASRAGLGLALAGGHWPNEAWLVHIDVGMGTGETTLLRWTRGRWKRIPELQGNTIEVVAILPLPEERVLIIQNSTVFPATYLHLRGAPNLLAPVPTKSKDDKSMSAVRAVCAAATPEGQIFIGGVDIDDGRPAVERWSLGRADGVIDAVDVGGKGSVEAIAAVSDVEVVASIQTDDKRCFVGTFDGARWSVEPFAGADPLDGLRVAPSGEVWATTSQGALWHRGFDRAWRRVDLTASNIDGSPADWQATTNVWIDSSGTIWVTGARGVDAVLARLMPM